MPRLSARPTWTRTTCSGLLLALQILAEHLVDVGDNIRRGGLAKCNRRQTIRDGLTELAGGIERQARWSHAIRECVDKHRIVVRKRRQVAPEGAGVKALLSRNSRVRRGDDLHASVAIHPGQELPRFVC